MLRRLHTEQPESFAFTPDNMNWAKAQISKYPEGRQASAVIPLLWRGQEQEGWVSKPMIEAIADMLGMAYIRVLEVASFYFMFQLKPVGSVAHFQICGTTSCMICGAEDLIAVCKSKIAAHPHELSADGKFSWEEVECLGACSNAPMAQIGKDYYEDLTAERFAEMIDEFARGEVPTPGPQNGRWAAEPKAGLTSLVIPEKEETANASKALAAALGDTVMRITDGRGVCEPYISGSAAVAAAAPAAPSPSATPAPVATGNWTDRVKTDSGMKGAAGGPTGIMPSNIPSGEATLRDGVGAWVYRAPAAAEAEPVLLSAAREGGADDLKLIKGVGPGLERTLNELGFYHYDQIAAWTEAQIAWVDARLKFKGRIARDGWPEQARILAAGGETEFSARSKKG